MVSESLTPALEETLAVFEDSGVPRTTSEVADCLDLGRRSTYARLDRLVEQNRLETKKVGANGRVWWLPPSETTTQPRSSHHREDSKQFETLVEAVEEYAIFTLDTGGYVQTWNPGAERIKGYEASEILGEHFSTFYADDDREADIPERNLSVAAGEGTVEDEGWRVRRDGSRFWADVILTAMRDDDGNLIGYAKVTRDMTSRREYEEELRQQRNFTQQVLEIAPVGVLTVEQDGTFVTANQRATELLDLECDGDGQDTVGVNAVYDEDGEYLPPDGRPYVRAFTTGESVRNWHAQVELSNGRRRWLSTNIEPMVDESGDVERVLVTIEDISQLKERAKHLQRQREDLKVELESVFDRVDEGFFTVDDTLRFTYVNQQASDFLGRPSSDLVEEYLWNVFEPAPEIVVAFEKPLKTQQPTSFEHFYESFETWFDMRVYPADDGLSVYFHDITDRKQRERELKRFEVLITKSRDVNVVLEPDGTYQYVPPSMKNVLGHDPEELVGETPFDYVHPEDREQVFEKFHRLVENPEREPTAEYRLQRADGSWAVMESRGRNLLDVPEVEGIVIYSRDITERKQRERELEHQREQLTALNSLNEVVSQITDAVIDQSTRKEIEATVCQHLASSESYLFAWVGDVDAATQTLHLRTEAGVEGYLDDITISVDPDDDRSAGPTGRAFRTGEMQTTHDVDTDPRYDPWRDHIDRYDFRSVAAIPVVYEGTVYGVLTVYAERPAAFEGREGEVIAQIGEIVGHAIAAAERKRALMSDELVELELQIPDVFEDFDTSVEATGTITLDHVVPAADDKFLVYGTATPDALDTVTGLVEVDSHWETVTVRSEGDPVSFESRLTGPPVLSVVAAIGGYVDTAVIEDGDYRLTIHLAPSADVRRVLDAIEEEYPQTEMLRHQQSTRRHDDPQRIQRQLVSDLTDRQRTALNVAYYAGFFEWPRETSGEELAESLGVTPPTFHSHLRKAERKVFDALFSLR